VQGADVNGGQLTAAMVVDRPGASSATWFGAVNPAAATGLGDVGRRGGTTGAGTAGNV
jgi:hypothetical protein